MLLTWHRALLSAMTASHALGRDLCLVGRAGGGKSVVAEARREAQGVRARAFRALSKQQRTNQFEQAEGDFQRAERHYDQQEHLPARELYQKAKASFSLILEQVPAIGEAFGTQARAAKLRQECEELQALEFASDDFSRGRQAELTGDQALANGRPLAAAKAYGEALYRYRKALQKAKPHAASKREYDALLQLVSDARQYCVDEKLTWKPNYKRAEERLRQAE
ncbi:MAG: hypothetical protein ABGW95_02135, partial [Candidatus Poseidoniia archaeon]